MATFFISVSLVFNLLAFFAIALLFLRQNRLLLAEKKQENMMREIEEVLSSYLIQLKEENEEFINRLNNTEIQESQSLVRKTKEDWEQPLVAENQIVREDDLQKSMINTKKYHAAKAYKQSPEIAGIEDLKETQDESLLSQILQFKKLGYNTTEIAQKLNMGKTEVALLLKFNENTND